MRIGFFFKDPINHLAGLLTLEALTCEEGIAMWFAYSLMPQFQGLAPMTIAIMSFPATFFWSRLFLRWKFGAIQ